MTNGKIYIGKTTCIYRRCHQYIHSFDDEDTSKINEYLLRAMRKAGIENFEMFPLEFVETDLLAEREIYWMDHFGTNDRTKGYNLRRDSSTGVKVSESTRVKISNRLKVEWASGLRDGHSEKMKTSWKSSARRTSQGLLMSQIRTKYEYKVLHPCQRVEICLYPRLRELGLASGAISSFHRTGLDSAIVKGHVVTRSIVGEASWRE